MDIVDERASALAAGMAIGRLDAMLAQDSARPLFESCLLRREALAVASAEGFAAQEETLARILQDETETFLDRGARAAHDAHSALSQVLSWGKDAPDVAMILEALRLSSRSNPRRRSAEEAWQVEDDAAALAEALGGLSEEPNPWLAGECFRRLRTDGDFGGQGPRLALLVAPWLVRVGFESPSILIGLVSEIGRDPDGARLASTDPDAWSAYWTVACQRAAVAADDLLGTVRALRRTLAAACPAERSTARTADAIDFLIQNPVATAASVGRELSLTPRGTKSVLDRLLAAGIVEATDGRRRNRVFLCRRALAGRA